MIIQSVKMAMKSITSNKMRSFLTMLGIIIGIVSLVVLVSIANGASKSVTDSINSMGTNLLTVSILDDKEVPLKLKELDTFLDAEHIGSISAVGSANATAKSGYNSESTSVKGVMNAYQEIQGIHLLGGRFIKTSDVDNHTNIAVISEDLATDVLEVRNPVMALNQTISLNGRSYTIVGIIEEESTSSNSNATYEAYIPYTSLMRLSDAVSNITTFVASATSDETINQAEQELTLALLNRFQNDEEAFNIMNQSTIKEALDSVSGTLALMLGGIAGISLLVGGIGIMNIMLVSVTERTREIGIRKAIGAGRGSIMLQFLIEALLVSLMGCALGILFSFGILKIVGIISGEADTFVLSTDMVWIAVMFSCAIGVLFGLYPANKAAKKNPIDALRYTG